MNKIPLSLVLMISDSEVEVWSWNAKSQKLILRLIKDACVENGKVIFRGVSFVSLPPRFTVEGIRVEPATDSSIPNAREFEGEYVFIFDESWGEEFYVIAESLEYEIAV